MNYMQTLDYVPQHAVSEFAPLTLVLDPLSPFVEVQALVGYDNLSESLFDLVVNEFRQAYSVIHIIGIFSLCRVLQQFVIFKLRKDFYFPQ